MDKNIKFIISGILIAVIGLVLSHTYRPYVYENHINDIHLADVIGSVVCVPAAVLCAYGIDSRYSIKQYTIGAAIAYIAYLMDNNNFHKSKELDCQPGDIIETNESLYLKIT